MDFIKLRLSKTGFPVCLILIALSSFLFFKILYCHDNKYTWKNPSASMGIAAIDMKEYETASIYYLVDGWEYYDSKLLTPDQIPHHTPDEYLFIGRYAGFERGDSRKSPYGCATYRLTIFTDDIIRPYAIEVPPIYSEWKFYINGALMADHYNPPDNRMIRFTAQNMIEIVVAVSDDHSLYSGFTHPPAFGLPKEVSRILTQKLLIHCAGTAIAMLLSGFCLLLSFSRKYTKPFRRLSLLCLFIAFSTGYPLIDALYLIWDGWIVTARFCYYGSIVMIAFIHFDICETPRKYLYPVVIFSTMVLVLNIIQPHITFPTAAHKYLYGDIMDLYKWFIALWLIGTGFLAVYRQIYGSKILLSTAIIFACALLVDRLYPLFEPVRFGWPADSCSFFYILTISFILCQNTIEIYHREAEMETALKLAALKEQSLSETNLLKSKFLSNISHELKVPLTVISGYAQLSKVELSDEIIPVTEIQEHMQRIIREADRMEQMVLQLLDVTRIETDRFSLDLEPAALEGIITQVVNDHFPVLNDQHNSLHLEIQPNMPPLLCDVTRIVQVLINLLSNACRHTSNGSITIRAAADSNLLKISVTDTGDGISPELISGLFERYLQTTDTQIPDKKVRGAGLGLYICKVIVEAHNGNISVSTAIGRGTTFSFTLPVDPTNNMEIKNQDEHEEITHY